MNGDPEAKTIKFRRSCIRWEKGCVHLMACLSLYEMQMKTTGVEIKVPTCTDN